MTDREPFEGWAIVELMGHRRLAGQISEQEVAGTAFLRLDVPAAAGDGVTQFYSTSAIYCITPTTEEIARKIGARSVPAPVSRFELEPLKPVDMGPLLTGEDEEEDDYSFEDVMP